MEIEQRISWIEPTDYKGVIRLLVAYAAEKIGVTNKDKEKLKSVERMIIRRICNIK